MKTKDQEQATLFKYASEQERPEWNMMFSIPDGGKRQTCTALRLKTLGMKDGVPDLFLGVVRWPYCGLFIDIKGEHGKVVENERNWYIKLRKEGYKVVVCRGCDEAVMVITDYLNGNEGIKNMLEFFEIKNDKIYDVAEEFEDDDEGVE